MRVIFNKNINTTGVPVVHGYDEMWELFADKSNYIEGRRADGSVRGYLIPNITVIDYARNTTTIEHFEVLYSPVYPVTEDNISNTYPVYYSHNGNVTDNILSGVVVDIDNMGAREEWVNANVIVLNDDLTRVVYNGEILAMLSAGQTATLPCKDHEMATDIAVVAPKTDGYIKPSGTKLITENGTYPVAAFESVDVQVDGGSSTVTYVFNEALVQSGSFATYDKIDDVPDDVLKTGVNVNITSLPGIPEINEAMNGRPLPAFIFPVNIGQLFAVYIVTINESGKCEPFLISADNTKGGGGIENKLTGTTVELIDYGDYHEWFEANTTPVGGACNKKHVTELEELPTDGLVEGEIYKVKKKALLSIAVYTDDGLIIDYFGYLFWLLGAVSGTEDGEVPEGFYRYSKEIPTDTPDVSDIGAFCYVESEDMLYGYDPEALTWVSMADSGDSDFPYIGAITSAEQVTEYGLYAYLGYEGTEFYEIMPESYKLIVWASGKPIDIGTLIPCEVIPVPTLPTENIKTSSNTSMHCYYAEDQQNVFIHDGNEWMLFSDESETSFGGLITSMGQATDEGKFYVLTNNGGLVDYFHPEASLKISAAGTYDVTKYATVNANIPTYAIYGKRKIPLTNIPSNLTVPINFTTTYQGEIINCTHMKFEWGFMDDGVSIYYIKEDGESIYVFYDGLSAGDVREGTCLYVDFGNEPQLVVKEFAEYMAQAIPLFETTTIPDITFTINGVEYTNKYAISWHEFAKETEGFDSTGYWYDYVSALPGYKSILHNGVQVKARDMIIDGAAYTISGVIPFTINGLNYSAEEGMTWQKWVASAYNTDGYVIDTEEGVVWYGTECQVLYQGNTILGSAEIVSGRGYDHNSG
jgi:hypothetical protein